MSTRCIRILGNSQVTQSKKEEEETSQDSAPNMPPKLCYQSDEKRPRLSDGQQKFLCKLPPAVAHPFQFITSAQSFSNTCQ